MKVAVIAILVLGFILPELQAIANFGNVGVHSTTKKPPTTKPPRGVLTGWCKSHPSLCVKYTFGSTMKRKSQNTFRALRQSLEIPDDSVAGTKGSTGQKIIKLSSVKKIVDTSQHYTKSKFKLATFTRLSLKLLGSRRFSK